MRSIPMPNANPLYFLESRPQLSSTFGSTIPQPKISTQPLYLQMLQPLPLQMLHEISTSALGSVNGKYEGLSLIFVSFPKTLGQNYNSVCLRSEKETFSSM